MAGEEASRHQGGAAQGAHRGLSSVGILAPTGLMKKTWRLLRRRAKTENEERLESKDWNKWSQT